MILIADSGATKTDWCFGSSHKNCQIIQTEGINPFHQTEDKVNHILQIELTKLLPFSTTDIQTVYFYGAGCTTEKSEKLSHLLKTVFPQANIEVNSDLLGAARALCKHQPGIACILGTGANSCLYDGKKIIQNIPPLGYILGDEGSGAYLGKRFLGDCIKEQLPSQLLNGLMEEYNLTLPEILDKVYRQPLANRFLASLTPYIYKQKDIPEIQQFLIECFSDFFRRNVLPYTTYGLLPVSFTGSVAWYFRQEIQEAASILKLSTGHFVQSPISELTHFHFPAESV